MLFSTSRSPDHTGKSSEHFLCKLDVMDVEYAYAYTQISTPTVLLFNHHPELTNEMEHSPAIQNQTQAKEITGAIRSKTCNQCNQAESKYTCPGCSARTCSLGCSNAHKVDKKCSGKRNRVEFVHLKEYSWGRLMQDYSYLEEIHRHLSEPRHSSSTQSTDATATTARLQQHPSRHATSKRDSLIRKAALEGVGLSLMPDGMSRRKLNMTHFNQKKKLLQWSLELIFPWAEQDANQINGHPLQPQDTELNNQQPTSASSSKQQQHRHHHTSHLLHQISSDTKLIEILKRTLNLKKLKISSEKRRLLLDLIEKQPEQKEEEGVEDKLIFTMKIELINRAENDQHSSTLNPELQREVHMIESSSTLSEALKDTKVLEWPKIEVWTRDEWTSQINSGRVKVVSKIKSTIPSTGSKPPVDSGWPAAKRIRIDHQSDLPSLSTSTPNTHLPHTLTSNNLQTTTTSPSVNLIQSSSITLDSLLQYSSSEDET
ncbi:hypothetical protein Pst134EB_020228 [Puccinia striiformis f. sp. tritici]|nr:hypothetical protein Pst134EB_020228 [Puccinia striiformis f. sp. tritici]